MSQKTVFVIGAGASKEADLPDGNDLKIKISELLDIQINPLNHSLEEGDNKILEALNLHVTNPDGSKGDITPFLQAARQISNALPLAESIDNYINQHRDNDKIELCAKLAIVRSILNAEKESKLCFEREIVDSHIYFNVPENTWYTEFFKLLTGNCYKSELKERFKSITLIIFNYDRCVEHFLYCALQLSYRLHAIEAGELVKNINIYHPYGSVGALPWIDPKGSGPGLVEFGMVTGTEQLLNLTQQIKTFAEGTDPDSSEIIKIQEHMEVSNKLVFLGFTFHKLNMELISPKFDGKREPNRRLKCFATALTISNSDQEIIRKQICMLYRIINDDIIMVKLKCGSFFSEFCRSLAF